MIWRTLQRPSGRRWSLSVVTFTALILAAGLGVSSCNSPSLIGATAPCRGWAVPPAEPSASAPAREDGPVVRMAILNIRAGGGPGFFPRGEPRQQAQNLHRLSQALAAAHRPYPDVVALNEVDFSSRRSNFRDQARDIADALSAATGRTYRVIAGAAWEAGDEGGEVSYGNALLTHLPIERQRACLFDALEACGVTHPPASALQARTLSAPWSWISSEPRGVVMADLTWHDTPIRVIATHLDPYSASVRERQAALLVESLVDAERPTVVMGDINAVPTVLTWRRPWFAADRTHDVITSGRLADVRYDLAPDERRWTQWATYPAWSPQWPIDAVLASPDLAATRLERFDTRASDHLGLAVTLQRVGATESITKRLAQHQAWQRHRAARIIACDFAGATDAAQSAWTWLGEQVENATLGLTNAER